MHVEAKSLSLRAHGICLAWDSEEKYMRLVGCIATRNDNTLALCRHYTGQSFKMCDGMLPSLGVATLHPIGTLKSYRLVSNKNHIVSLAPQKHSAPCRATGGRKVAGRLCDHCCGFQPGGAVPSRDGQRQLPAARHGGARLPAAGDGQKIQARHAHA
eukprot:scaffold203651_cov21-Tisochrysis_lutea.AAC.1